MKHLPESSAKRPHIVDELGLKHLNDCLVAVLLESVEAEQYRPTVDWLREFAADKQTQPLVRMVYGLLKWPSAPS